MLTMTETERVFLRDFIEERELGGERLAFSEVSRTMKEMFGKGVNLLDVVAIRRELGLCIYFRPHYE